MKLVGAIAVAAILVLAVLIVASQSGGGDDGSEVATGDLLDGIPQNGTVLGEPDAPLTLVEFGDMQCPHCRDFSQEVMPEIIEGPVRDGEVKVSFLNWVVIDQRSALAAAASLAAAEQGYYWQYLDTFFAEPGREVSEENLRAVAEEAGVPDLDQWEDDLDDPRWDGELARIGREAQQLGFGGTPSFAYRAAGSRELIPIDPPGSAADVESLAAGG